MPPRYAFNANKIIEEGKIGKEKFDKLREWCAKEENLPELSSEQLVLFLLSCSNDVEAAKKTVHAHFKCKNEAPELFFNRDFNALDVQKAMAVVETALSPTKTVHNDGIFFWRFKDTSYSKFNLNQVLKIVFMIGELILYKDPPDDVIVVIDIKGISLLHLTKLRVGGLRKFFRFVQEGYACKIKQIHVLNTVYFIDKIMMILKPLMSKELYEMIRFHSPNMDYNEFYQKYLPIGCLPEDYGGTLPDLASLSIQTYNSLQGMKRFYLDEEQQAKEYKAK